MYLLFIGAMALSEAAADGRNVVLVDDGPTLMDDKREYRSLVTPGITLGPPGVKVRYQRLLTDNISLMVGGGIAGGGIQTCECEGIGWARWQGLAGVDLHPMGNGLHGLYLGTRALYRHGDMSMSLFNRDVSAEKDIFSVRGIIGYRWIIDPGLSVAAGIGGGYRQVLRSYAIEDTDAEIVTQTAIPAVELNLSWAF